MTAASGVAPAPEAWDRSRFLRDAESFARAHRGALAFRYLRWLTGCSEEELEQLIGKIYCDSLPESSTGSEPRLSSAARSLGHPVFYALTKKIFWKREAFVESDLETITRPYFDRWFQKIYAALKEPKRLTPRTFKEFDGFNLSQPIDTSVSFGTLLKLFVAPLFIPWLLLCPPKEVRARFLRSFRKAISFFAVYDGHFNRYPCRDFITFADETNHPSRYLAFKRRCSGRLIVIQNGAREIHPVHGFGMADIYLVFGPFAEQACRDLRVKVGKTIVVGALCLNEWHPLWESLKADSAAPLHDILFVDQSVWPHNGIDKVAGDAMLRTVENLGKYQQRRPDCRIVYQLRFYPDAAEKADVLAAVKSRLPESVKILENAGKGDSYRSIFRSRLVITFSSTLGIEAFFFGDGKKVLFVNYTGSPVQDFAPEPRFQLSDPTADYGRFEVKVDELLALELQGVPASAREHHAFFDGKVEERIAAAIAKEQS